MQPKPDFYGPQFASAFQDPSVAEAYQYRPTYPAEVFDILASLIVDSPRHVLDAGCGTGALARYLVERVDRVDAVDVSREMIERGKRLPHGDHPHLNWIVGQIEDVPLHPPYALITTGDSLHWMDWYVVMPRFTHMLTPHGYLAILGVDRLPIPWEADLWSIIRRYSTVPNGQYYDYIKGVEERGLFQRVGMQRTKPVPFTQSLEDYIESFHGRASLSRERMAPTDVAAFDAEVGALVSSFCQDNTVELQLVSEVVWGKPLHLDVTR